MKQIIEVLKYVWCNKVSRGVFLLILFIIIWNNVYSLTGTGGIWYNLFNSFLSSVLSPRYQIGIYLTIWCCQIITVISSSSRSWVRRLSNFSSISLSLVMLLTDSCPTPHFWKHLIIVYIFSIFQQGFFPVNLWKTNLVHPCSRCFLNRNLKLILADVQSMIEWSFLVCFTSNPHLTWSVCFFKLF